MRALLIHNLHSGQRRRAAEITAAAEQLGDAGWKVETATTTEIREVERLSRAAVAAGMEIVVVAGGDGTLNAAVQALAHQKTALGVIPLGTANVWAREMRIPLDVRAAARSLLAGQIAQVDLGQANGRYFLFVAGVGFDASVTKGMEPRAKRRLGMLAYGIAAIVQALHLRGEEVTLISEDRVLRQRTLMVVANNTRLYGGLLNMAPEAFVDDGLLDIVVFRGRGLQASFRHLLHTLAGLHHRDPEVQHFQSPTVYVECRSSLPVQLDGDYFGTTPVAFGVAPRALRTIIPRCPHPQLRHAPPE